MAAVEGEVGLVDPARSELAGHQGDGLGASVGEQEPICFDAHACGQSRPGRPRVGIAPDGVEVPGHRRAWIGGEGVQAGGEVEHGARLDTEGQGQPGAVAAVGAGRRRHRHHAEPRGNQPPRPGPDQPEQRHGRGHLAAEPDGAADVGRSRGRTGPEPGTDFAAPGVGVGAAQAHPEGGREGGLGHAGVGRGMGRGLMADSGPDPGRRSGPHRRDQEGGQAGRKPPGDVVGPGRGPAEPGVARRAVADHGVEGVDRPVGQHRRRSAPGRPNGGGDDGVDGVLGYRFHHRPDDLRLVEAGRLASRPGPEAGPGPRRGRPRRGPRLPRWRPRPGPGPPPRRRWQRPARRGGARPLR